MSGRDREEMIQERAHAIWQRRGDREGTAQDNWDEAEREVSEELGSSESEDAFDEALALIQEEPSVAGDPSEEDDDNPHQESDAALPDDADEDAIADDPSREATRFDEVMKPPQR